MGRRWSNTLFWSAACAALMSCGDGALAPVPCEHEPMNASGYPRIVSMDPEAGIPGTKVTLTGAFFDQIDDRYEAVYADFSTGCDFATLEGVVTSDTQIEVIIPEEATASGYIYLVAAGVTVTRSPARFDLDAIPRATVRIVNQAQFPIVTADASWEPMLEVGDRVDVDETRDFEISSGPMHLELCLGGRSSTGGNEPWACETYDGRLDPGEAITISVAPAPAARFLAGEWEASWSIGEDMTDGELLRIDPDGYWEIRYGGRVVESGMVLDSPWAPYATQFEFGLRPADPTSSAEVPVRSFSLISPRAGDRVAFHRAE